MSEAVYVAKPYLNTLGRFEIRRWYLHVQEVLTNESWKVSGTEHPLRKIVVAAVIRNPFAGRYEQDLAPIVEDSGMLGQEFGRRLVRALAGQDAESFGKACVVGEGGEYEHGNAFLTSVFAKPIRNAIGDATSWIPSSGKRGGPGTSIDIPLAHKAELYSRSHYDTVTAVFDDAPVSDEVVIAFAVATSPRVMARLGGPQVAS
jgi:hypothetical protein